MSLPSPSQNVQLALIRPNLQFVEQDLLGRRCEQRIAISRGIFAPSQLCVPKITLPDGSVVTVCPRTRSVGFPEFYPRSQRHRREFAGCTEQVNVVWHDYVASDDPQSLRLPCVTQALVRGVVRQDRFPVLRTYRQENNYRCVETFDGGQMCRPFPPVRLYTLANNRTRLIGQSATGRDDLVSSHY